MSSNLTDARSWTWHAQSFFSEKSDPAHLGGGGATYSGCIILVLGSHGGQGSARQEEKISRPVAHRRMADNQVGPARHSIFVSLPPATSLA
eukprot:1151703-Pelagomonas_calceolata.AAC.2